MAEAIVPPEMINRAAYEELRVADMPEDQAKAVAAHLPDWSQFATKQDLARLENRLAWRMVQVMGLPVVLLVPACLAGYFFARPPAGHPTGPAGVHSPLTGVFPG